MRVGIIDKGKNMTKLSRVEALVSALAHLNAWEHPTSRAFKNRNPILLKAFSQKHEKDEDGFRVFNSVPSGWDNAVTDLQIKCSGKSHANIKETDTLKTLVKFFGNDASATRSVKNYLRHALNTEDIYENTELKWFVEDDPKYQSTEEVNG